MKKAIQRMVIAVSALVVATSQTVQSESVPWYNSFETNTVGVPITNNNEFGFSEFGMWTGADEEDFIAVVTNIGSYAAKLQSPAVNTPLAGDHNNVVMFSGAGLTNTVTGGADGNVWVDMMLQPVPMDTETPPMSEAISNSQVSIYVDTNGFVNVYHAALTNDGFENLANGWTVLTDFPGGSIGTDKWVRLTMAMDYTDPTYTGVGLFQIRVNGHLFTNQAAMNDNYDFTRNGTRFVCANANGMKINSLAFSGTGKFDDLVVTNGAVTYIPVVQVIAWAGPGGLIDPSGPIQMAEGQTATNFAITANPFFHIFDIQTNNSTLAGLSLTGNETSTNLELTGIVESMTLDVYFAPDMAANDTPKWWLFSYGLTNDTPNWDAQALGDPDNDGAFTWEEYVAGTIPTNGESVLKILSGEVAGGMGTVVWQSTTNMPDPSAVFYVIQASSNLMDNVWGMIGKTNRVEGAMTNTVPAVGSPAFIRVSFTNQ